MDSPGTPEAAVPFLDNLLAWGAIAAICIILFVWFRYGWKEAAITFVVAVVAIGGFGAFVTDPVEGFAGAWEFMKANVFGMDGGGGSPPSGSGSGGG